MTTPFTAHIRDTLTRAQLIDQWSKEEGNKMPDYDEYKNDRCRTQTKLDNKLLFGFDCKHTKSDEVIAELEDHDVDVAIYETDESIKEHKIHDEKVQSEIFKHQSECDHIMCNWSHKRDLMLIEKGFNWKEHNL